MPPLGGDIGILIYATNALKLLVSWPAFVFEQIEKANYNCLTLKIMALQNLKQAFKGHNLVNFS